MSSSSIRKHAGTGAASDQPTVPEPSFSERARTLVYLGRIGSLSTLSRKQSGFPFGSVMPYGLDEHGRPIFLISTMAMHTQNLRADSRASLLVTQPDASGDPLGASRVTLMGNVLAIPESGVRRRVGSIWNDTSTANTGWTLKIFPFTEWTWWTFTTWAASG
jgi:hypothetical protein